MAGEGIELSLAQPCYPVQVAHGHVLSLFERDVDYVLVPNMLDNEAHEESPTVAHFCPWTQTLPFVLRSAPRLEPFASRVLALPEEGPRSAPLPAAAGTALRSPRFWLLWTVFFVNIATGILLIALARPML